MRNGYLNGITDFIEGRFIEPFVGSGVVFMNVFAESYVINDINTDLVLIYKALQTSGEEFIAACEELFIPENNTPERYNELREEFNSTDVKDIRKGALFIYLNRHGFNGLCRYNKSGGFNVPFGKYDVVGFPKENLKKAVSKLKNVIIFNRPFEDVIEMAGVGDTIYCLPEGSLIYQDGNYLPIEYVKTNQTDLGNGNTCTKKHVRHTTNEEVVRLNVMGISRHYDTVLSKNHVVFTYDATTGKIVEKQAGKLTTDDLLLIDYEKKVSDFIPKYSVYKEHHNNKKVIVNYEKKNELARLIGLYMAEGHKQGGIILSFSIHEHDLHLLTKKLIKDVFSLDAKICPKSPHKTVTQVRCSSNELEKYLLEFYNGKNARFKKLNNFVMEWPENMQLNLLIGWLEGDGGMYHVKKLGKNPTFTRSGKRNKFKLTGTTTSFELAGQMYNMALRCGLHPCFKKRVTKHKKPRKNGRWTTICYDVYFTMKKDIEVLMGVAIDGRSCGRRHHIDNYLVTRINTIKIEKFTGNMYDLTTIKGNFWCMGNVKVHNCDPPYVPMSATASFTDYAQTGFEYTDQEKLARLAEESKARIFISNHDNAVTRELYKNADEIVEIEVNRFISADKDSRKPVKELLAIYKNQ
jgi:DNA adenine methylase Dam